MFCVLASSRNLVVKAVLQLCEQILLFSTKKWAPSTFPCVFEGVKPLWKIFRESCKYLQTLLYALAQFLLTISESELDFYHQKLNVWAASRVVEQLKTEGLRKLGKLKRIPEKFRIDGMSAASYKLCKICCKKHSKRTPILLDSVI